MASGNETMNWTKIHEWLNIQHIPKRQLEMLGIKDTEQRERIMNSFYPLAELLLYLLVFKYRKWTQYLDVMNRAIQIHNDLQPINSLL